MFDDREKKRKNIRFGKHVFQVQFLTLGARVVICLGPISSAWVFICDMEMGCHYIPSQNVIMR